jgi:hypothetical protein
MSAPLATEQRRVFVVETWLENPGRWYCWSAHTSASGAWSVARECRDRYPDTKFRTTSYVSTKP